MYEYLFGKLIEKTPTHVILEVGGIAYQVMIPVSTFASLPQQGGALRIYTHFVVREDAHILYGFATQEERQMFRLLISVTGVGPKIALTILSGIPTVEFKKAIIQGSVVQLTGIPGIGRKIAERLIVELREKIVVEDHAAEKGTGVEQIQMNQERVEDSLRALVELGYRKQNAKEAIQKVLKNQDSAKLSVPDLIRASLKYM